MVECEWCGEKTKGEFEVVIAEVGRFEVCASCMNDYAGGDFESLEEKLKYKRDSENTTLKTLKMMKSMNPKEVNHDSD